MTLWLLPGVVVAQGIARQGMESEVARVDDGTVRLAYATRPTVEICDQGIRMGERQMWWRSIQGDRAASDCRVGSVEVELEVRGGRVRSVEVVRGEDRRSQDAVDIGEVGARDPEIRRTAMFWLAQSEDDRVLAFFQKRF